MRRRREKARIKITFRSNEIDELPSLLLKNQFCMREKVVHERRHEKEKEERS